MGGQRKYSKDQLDSLRERARLSDLVGRTVKLSRQGREWTGLCPFHDEKTPSFTVSDAMGIFKCFGCGAYGDVFDWLNKAHGLPFVEAVRSVESDLGLSLANSELLTADKKRREKREREQAERDEKKRRGAIGLWQYAAPIAGTPAQDYLEGRGIDFAKLGKPPGALRFRSDVWHDFIREKLPAMLAIMIDAQSRPVAVHRTFLEYRGGRWQKLKRIDRQASEKHGGMCRFHKAKLVLAPARGASIPLRKGASGKTLRDMPAGEAIQVSEGIEDGLTIALYEPEARIHAAYSLGNFGPLSLPPQCGDFIIIGQNDEQKGEYGPVSQLESGIGAQQENGRRVLVRWPPDGFKDFNDWHCAQIGMASA